MQDHGGVDGGGTALNEHDYGALVRRAVPQVRTSLRFDSACY